MALRSRGSAQKQEISFEAKDVSLHVQAQQASVQIDKASSEQGVDDNAGGSIGGSGPLLEVNRWSELAIGIDDDGTYWATTPPPNVGEIFKKCAAVKLPVRGKRWKALLEALARSENGNSTSRWQLLADLGYLPMPGSVDRDTRARPGNLDNGLRRELRERANPALNQLNEALSDLRRELRKYVRGPKGRGSNAVLRVDGDLVRSGFVVRHLLRDPARNIHFGQRPNV